MTSSNIQPDDYISFSGLRSFTSGILRFFFRACHLAGVAVRKRYWLVVSLTVLGGLAGWVYHTVFGQKYKVAMLVEYRTLDRTIYRDIVGEVNRLIIYGSGQQVAARLGVPVRLVEKVNKLGTADLNGSPLTEEPASGVAIFQITGEFRSPDGVDSLGNALIGYINGLPFLQSEMNEQMKIRQDQLEFIRKEQASIDSLHKDNLLDPGAVYRHASSLDSLRASIRKSLIHGDRALTPITEFRAASKPQSAPGSFVVVVLALAGLLAGFLMAVVLELKYRIG